MKEIPDDIIILQMCTINGSHMMYGSWDMECNTEFFVILDHFMPFTPLKTEKIKNKHLETLSFYTCVP